MDKLLATSALQAEYRPGRYGAQCGQALRLVERRGLSMWNLVVFEARQLEPILTDHLALTLPAVCRASANQQAEIIWIGAGRYLLVSHSSPAIQAMSVALDGNHGALQDLSSSRVVITMTGESSRNVLAKGINVSLAPGDFKPGQVILSSFDHHFPAIIHNVSGVQDKFDIYVARSLALSFWHWLTDSSLEYGFEVDEPQLNG